MQIDCRLIARGGGLPGHLAWHTSKHPGGLLPPTAHGQTPLCRAPVASRSCGRPSSPHACFCASLTASPSEKTQGSRPAGLLQGPQGCQRSPACRWVETASREQDVGIAAAAGLRGLSRYRVPSAECRASEPAAALRSAGRGDCSGRWPEGPHREALLTRQAPTCDLTRRSVEADQRRGCGGAGSLHDCNPYTVAIYCCYILLLYTVAIYGYYIRLLYTVTT